MRVEVCIAQSLSERGHGHSSSLLCESSGLCGFRPFFRLYRPVGMHEVLEHRKGSLGPLPHRCHYLFVAPFDVSCGIYSGDIGPVMGIMFNETVRSQFDAQGFCKIGLKAHIRWR